MANILNRLKITNHFIPDIEWNDIPQFSVITGVNGSGKTQLLNAINAAALKMDSIFDYETDLDVKKNEYGFVAWNQGLGQLGSSNYADFEKQREEFIKKSRTRQHRANDGASWLFYTYFKKNFDVDLNRREDSFFESMEFRKKYEEAWIYTAET